MQKSFEERFLASRTTQFTETFWNGMIREVGLRLRTLESIKVSFDELTQLGIEVVLARLNEVLLPAAQKIRDLSTLGFLIARSETPVTLALGSAQFIVVDGPQRELFTPSEFVAIARASTAADYAVAHVLEYDAESGVLEVEIEAIFGDPGPHDDWEIGALAGSTMASVAMLAEVRAKYTAVLSAAAAAAPAAATATTQAGIATDAAAQAVAAAQAAATFDPANYYPKTATYSKAQVDTAIGNEATARATAVSDEVTARTNADAALSTAVAAIKFATLRPHQVKTASFAAGAFYRYRCETAGGAITSTLPATPSDGDIITIRRKGANNLTIGRNGKTISGSGTDLVIDTDKREVELTYNATTGDWEVVARAYA